MDRNEKLDQARSDKAIAELLGHAGPRMLPPAAEESLVRGVVHAEWQRVSGGRARRRKYTMLAVAASVLLAVFASLSLLREPLPDFSSQQLATLQKQFGTSTVNAQVADVAQLAAIMGGDIVATGDAAGLALQWHGGGSLRLDAATSVVFESENIIYLQQGRVYFDSEVGLLAPQQRVVNGTDLKIRTDYGVVHHLGTQYMTAVDSDELVVSVREGLVSIDGRVRASRGQQFTLTTAGDLSTSDTNGVHDWEWIEQSTPTVKLYGRRVHDALAWVSRESGRSIRYATPEAEALARTAILRDDFDIDVEPTRKLEIFMLTVDLNARIEDELIVVSVD
jgi:hypothetical protein